MTVVRLVVLALLVGTGLQAQDQAQELTRELTLERDLALAKIALRRLETECAASQVQLEALSQALNAVLARRAREVGAALDVELKPIEDRLVRALGGDPGKGDRYDWSAQGLKRGESPPTRSQEKPR